MFELNTIATDPQLELNGVWRPFTDGSELLIARIGNPAYRSLLRRKVKANRAVLDNEDDLADKVSDKVLGEVMAETVLLGWRGVTVNGAEVPYTKELGAQLLTDPSNRDFREKVKAYAEDAEAYRKRVEDNAVKNS